MGETHRASSSGRGETPTRRPVPVRLRDWHEVYEPFPEDDAEAAGRALHGLRHPVLQQRLPARQPHPRLERPRLPRPLARRDRAAARHQQLPRVHRPAVPGAVRGRVRARHQPGPGHHQAGRGRDRRPRLERGLDRAGRARRCAPASRSRSSAPAPPGSPPRSSSRAPATTSSCSSAPTASAGCCATASPSSRWRSATSTAASSRWRPRAPSSASTSNVGVDVSVEELRERVRRHRARRRRHRVARPARSPAASTAASTRRWSTCRWATGCSRATSTSRRSPPRASTSSSSAAATPAPTASAPRTARARRRSTSSRSCPRPPDSRAPTNPWPTWSNVFRVSSAHEEGGERVYSVNTECFLGDDDGNVRALRAHEVEMVDGKFEKIEGTDFELPCELVLLAMGFLGPQQEGLLDAARRRARRARQRRARPDRS